MVEHGNQCYDFSIDPNVNNVPWSIARDACQNSGLNMITEGSHGLDNWITDHLYNTGIFSYGYTVNGMWIGYYGKSICVCTLEFLISVAPQINIPPGIFGRNNKRTPLK